ncbi:MAG: hypothetical protein SP4CHLAM5_04800 [Chlamydiia bacterium]|nr:hypothetical protein [Chlamydiia bacterium]MCH9618351.1 hypothetical protein [Chlamydiia bacterium]MCH9624227.1 hypothetical protein [Chlamydiia bacterium]
MKQAILALTLISSAVFGSNIVKKTADNSIDINTSPTHSFYFNTGIQSSLYESAPPLLLLGVSYKYNSGDDLFFTGTTLSIDLGFTPEEEAVHETLLSKHFELQATARIMGSFATLTSKTSKCFFSIGTHCTLSSYQRYSIKLKVDNPKDLNLYVVSNQNIDSFKTYIGPSIVTGIEVFAPETELNSVVFYAGYDHPFISSEGEAPKTGAFYIGCGLGF